MIHLHVRETDFAQKNSTQYNRISILFHEIFRIDVEFHFDFTFFSGILCYAFKKFAGKILKFAVHFSEFGR